MPRDFRQLPNTQLRKMKTVKGTTYVSFSSHDEAKSAVEKLGGVSIKNRKLQVRFAAEEPQTQVRCSDVEILGVLMLLPLLSSKHIASLASSHSPPCLSSMF